MCCIDFILFGICHSIGIHFIVVTGVHPATAAAIAAQAGIITNPIAVHHASDLLEQSSFKDKDNFEISAQHDPNDLLQSITITGAELETLELEQEERRRLYTSFLPAGVQPVFHMCWL
jgi:sodium/potassium-transporting ATPase subunit alpha